MLYQLIIQATVVHFSPSDWSLAIIKSKTEQGGGHGGCVSSEPNEPRVRVEVIYVVRVFYASVISRIF